ncbi:MAG: hypothetical protein KME23_07135 [Goleter apudmare HA4340-LM2]|jgi:hypothetical protein|nr:hypothetical protein [Goleter apudmare HA4340-LM2]
MRRKNRLILNFFIVCLITALMFRDRSISELFEVSIIQQDEPSILIPGYQLACRGTDTLRCEISIDNLPLVVESASTTTCQGTYGKQTLTCERLQASALDHVFIEGLQLSSLQRAKIKAQIWVRSIASLRVLNDGAANGSLLQFLLSSLSVLSGFNVSTSLYFYLGRLYPHQHKLLKLLFSLIVGLGVFAFLLLYFVLLLMVFGYVG